MGSPRVETAHFQARNRRFEKGRAATAFRLSSGYREIAGNRAAWPPMTKLASGYRGMEKALLFFAAGALSLHRGMESRFEEA